MQAGADFAGYVIERCLGTGGMGSVYLARHPRLDRLVALKLLTDSFTGDQKARAAFDREVKLTARLDHPNIVAVYDRSGPDDPALWLTMRYVTGGDAGALLEAAPRGLPPELAVRLIRDAAEALDFAHDHGVVHRDVKPANLLIERLPKGGMRALLGDFGIARTLDDTVTLTSISVSFAYAAPERFTNSADHRADIYSLGCTLYHLLTGRYPFPRDDQAAVIAAHLTEAPPSPRTVRPELPVGFDSVIATALAKKPASRYPTCVALAEAAAQALTVESGPVPAVSIPDRPPAPQPRRPHSTKPITADQDPADPIPKFSSPSPAAATAHLEEPHARPRAGAEPAGSEADPVAARRPAAELPETPPRAADVNSARPEPDPNGFDSVGKSTGQLDAAEATIVEAATAGPNSAGVDSVEPNSVGVNLAGANPERANPAEPSTAEPSVGGADAAEATAGPDAAEATAENPETKAGTGETDVAALSPPKVSAGPSNSSSRSDLDPLPDAADHSDSTELEYADSAPNLAALNLVGPDLAAPDVAAPDVAAPDVAAPDVAGPDPVAPDLVGPDVAAPDVAGPGVAGPDPVAPDLVGPDVAALDVAVPDVAVPDVAVPDLAAPDLAVPDVAVPDLVAPDPAAPDRAAPPVRDVSVHSDSAPAPPGSSMSEAVHGRMPTGPEKFESARADGAGSGASDEDASTTEDANGSARVESVERSPESRATISDSSTPRGLESATTERESVVGPALDSTEIEEIRAALGGTDAARADPRRSATAGDRSGEPDSADDGDPKAGGEPAPGPASAGESVSADEPVEEQHPERTPAGIDSQAPKTVEHGREPSPVENEPHAPDLFDLGRHDSDAVGPGHPDSTGPVRADSAGPHREDSAGPVRPDSAGPVRPDFVGSDRPDSVGSARPAVPPRTGDGRISFRPATFDPADPRLDSAGPDREDSAGPVHPDFVGPVRVDFVGSVRPDSAGPDREDSAGPVRPDFVGPVRVDFVGSDRPDSAGSARPAVPPRTGDGRISFRPATSDPADPRPATLRGRRLLAGAAAVLAILAAFTVARAMFGAAPPDGSSPSTTAPVLVSPLPPTRATSGPGPVAVPVSPTEAPTTREPAPIPPEPGAQLPIPPQQTAVPAPPPGPVATQPAHIPRTEVVGSPDPLPTVTSAPATTTEPPPVTTTTTTKVTTVEPTPTTTTAPPTTTSSTAATTTSPTTPATTPPTETIAPR
nr:serine/threonine protein kinase [Nocardia bovistercoris]